MASQVIRDAAQLRGQRGHHAGQVSRAAGARDDHVDPSGLCSGGIFVPGHAKGSLAQRGQKNSEELGDFENPVFFLSLATNLGGDYKTPERNLVRKYGDSRAKAVCEEKEGAWIMLELKLKAVYKTRSMEHS